MNQSPFIKPEPIAQAPKVAPKAAIKPPLAPKPVVIVNEKVEPRAPLLKPPTKEVVNEIPVVGKLGGLNLDEPVLMEIGQVYSINGVEYVVTVVDEEQNSAVIRCSRTG